MDKKEARKILGVSKEISKNDLERKFSILLKKHRLVKEQPEDEDLQDGENRRYNGIPQDAAIAQDAVVRQDAGRSQEEYSFEQITQAYNILMGYEVPMKEEPPSKAAPLLKKAGIDERKARNFLHYYKFHMLGAIIAVIVIAFTIRGCVTRVDPDFNTAFIGEISYTETDKLKEAIKANIPEITEPGFDGAFITKDGAGEQQYAMVMKATVLFAAGDVDIFILDKDNFQKYAEQGAFLNLDDITANLEVDHNKKYMAKVRDSEETSGDSEAKEPAEEHLYGIDITESTALKEAGIFGREMIAALYVNNKQQDKAVKLLQFLLK